MKKPIYLMAMAALLLIVAAGFTSCGKKDYHILLSTQDLRFGLQPETQTLIINADCKWTVTKNDDADWYTISPMSGRANDSVITVTVNDYSEGDFREATFVINSPGGHVHRTVFVSQNRLEFYKIVNKVFGAMTVEHWNTDYYGMMVEDSYKKFEGDPYDTTRGYLMYYMEDGRGYQRDHHNDTVAWWAFTYSYDADSSILHIAFQLENDSTENYDPEVLCASDSLYRVYHEYEPHWFERADMRKVGTINPDEKEFLTKKVKAAKRKKKQPIFIID